MHSLTFFTSQIITIILNNLQLVHISQLCSKLNKLSRTIFLRASIEFPDIDHYILLFFLLLGKNHWIQLTQFWNTIETDSRMEYRFNPILCRNVVVQTIPRPASFGLSGNAGPGPGLAVELLQRHLSDFL